MRKISASIVVILLVVGIVLIIGSIAYLVLGPEQFAALYQRAAPVLPYLLSGVGLVVLCIVIGNVFLGWSDPPNTPQPGKSAPDMGKTSDSEAWNGDQHDTGIRVTDRRV
jgi:hypothetical protein